VRPRDHRHHQGGTGNRAPSHEAARNHGPHRQPGGLITAHARVAGGEVKSVYFQNVPSFVLALDETIEVSGLGRVRCDIAFGGAFYAYVNAAEVGVSCTPENFRALLEKGMAVKRAVTANRPTPHPFEEDLSFL
jgi:proline racemase